MLKFNEATYLSLLFKFILSERRRISLCRSKVSLFLEFINKLSILCYIAIELYKEYKEYKKNHTKNM